MQLLKNIYNNSFVHHPEQNEVKRRDLFTTNVTRDHYD